MSDFDVFKGLALDRWYKALVWMGGALLLASLFKETKGITNGQLQLLAAGTLFIGLGEWKNHKVASYIKPPNVYTGPTALVSYPVWEPDLVGVFFDLAGAGLIARGVWLLAHVR